MKLTNAFLIFLGIGALSMLIMSTQYFHTEPNGILRGNDMTPFLWYRITLLMHISTGLVAITTGPFQFIAKLRQKRINLHRRLGYVYSLAVFCSALSGLCIAPYSMGGITTAIGFSLLSLLWMISLGKALLTIRAGQIDEHRKWMFFNYAFTFAAITQRTLLLFAILPFFSFMPIYKLSAWLPWMVNLFIAWRILKKRGLPKVSMIGIFLLITLGLHAQDSSTYTLAVTVGPIEETKGSLRVCFIGSDASKYLSDCDTSLLLSVSASSHTLTFDKLPSGTNCMYVYHDVNGDQQLSTEGVFGLPSEPYGFSNNPRTLFGPPSFTACQFKLRENKEMQIKLK